MTFLHRRIVRKKDLQSNLMAKRRSYERHVRAAIIETIDKNIGQIGGSFAKGAKSVCQQIKGFERFRKSTAKRMRRTRI